MKHISNALGRYRPAELRAARKMRRAIKDANEKHAWRSFVPYPPDDVMREHYHPRHHPPE